MPTSRPLVDGDQIVAICSPYVVGEAYIRSGSLRSELFVLCSDFDLPLRGATSWWNVVGQRVFGINGCMSANDPRLDRSVQRSTAPCLYVREGDQVAPWSTYRNVLRGRVIAAQRIKHQDFIAHIHRQGGRNIQLRIEDDVVVICCTGNVSESSAPEGVRVEAIPPGANERASDSIFDETVGQAVRDSISRVNREFAQTYQGIPLSPDVVRGFIGSQQRLTPEPEISVPPGRYTVSIDISTPPSPPPPTRFNLLECDLPAVPATTPTQKRFGALAELQASFRAARGAAQPTQKPVLSRFELLECDEPAEPVKSVPVFKLKHTPSPTTAPTAPARRTVEEILDLTTKSPIDALASLQIAQLELVRELWQRETN